ncbi:hypothetical protein QR685DRAFT_55329 [Neurospora intermedia]|uniref:Uncharacterized protein n=1 Tax=Neurospora intermedia TaxID=5142 RepID=A0ABR3DSL4_NEUIN
MYLLRRYTTTLTTPYCRLSHPIPRSIPQSAISSVVPNNCKFSSNPCLTSRRYYTCSVCRPQLMAASGLMVLALYSIVSSQSIFPRAPSVLPPVYHYPMISSRWSSDVYPVRNFFFFGSGALLNTGRTG